jgi:ornithine cyclodeaminase/alanine dehydrogenase-like protein (mu-crystallin family)
MRVLVLSHADVERLLPMDECIDLMADALSALARGQVFQPLRMVVRPPQAKGLLALMPAHLAGARPAYGVKALTFFPSNPAIGKDAHQGSVLLYDNETGELRALMNASAITAIRTAAVSGAATRALAREDASVLALVGAGVQARSHLAAMASVRPIKEVRVVCRRLDKSKQFAQEMSARYRFPIVPKATVEEAVGGAQIVVTATTSAEPVVRSEWISAGAHLNAVGASVVANRELDSATVRASTLFVDRRESALAEAGDLVLAVKDGVVGPDHIRGELGEVLIGAVPGRQSPNEITLFKSLGLAVEDVASADFLYAKALRLGAGQYVEF